MYALVATRQTLTTKMPRHATPPLRGGAGVLRQFGRICNPPTVNIGICNDENNNLFKISILADYKSL